MRKVYARAKEPFLVFLLFCVLVVAVRAAAVVPPSSGTVIFTDYNQWLAAIGGSPSSRFNFNDVTESTPLPFNYNGLYLDVGGSAEAAIQNGLINASFGDTTGFFNLSLAQPFSAIGFNLFNVSGLINFSFNGESYLLSDGFWGMAGSAINFGSFSFNGPVLASLTDPSTQAGFLLDNVAVKVVPEPQTLVLLLIGLGAGVQVYRRRRQAALPTTTRD